MTQGTRRVDRNRDELSPSGAIYDVDHDPIATYSDVQSTVERRNMVIKAIWRKIIC